MADFQRTGTKNIPSTGGMFKPFIAFPKNQFIA
jgi:hypothetical protein